MKRLLSLSCALPIAAIAFAFVSSVPVFNSKYNVKPGSTLGKAKCAVCHAKPAGGKVNAYGKDVAAAMKKLNAKKVTAEILAAVEKLDSNGNGVKNVDDIKADKLPG